MAYAYVQDVAASWQQYQQVAESLVEPAPAGLILHVAGPTDEGVRIIDVWDSEQAWQAYRATFRDLHPEHVLLRQTKEQTT